MANISPPDVILLWTPIGNALNTASNGLVDQSTGYPIVEPYENTGVHYTGEVGVTLRLNTGVDLTLATSVFINVQQPNGSTSTWLGTVVGLDGVNSVVQYITQSGDFYYPGTYIVQPSVTFNNWTGVGETSTFTIYNSIVASPPSTPPTPPPSLYKTFLLVATQGQTVFNMGMSPSTILFVAINGTIQATNSYAFYSGSTITMSSGLNAGDELFGSVIL